MNKIIFESGARSKWQQKIIIQNKFIRILIEKIWKTGKTGW